MRKFEAVIDEIKHRLHFIFPQQDIAILDDLYPHPISIFRNIEFQNYLKSFKKVAIYSTGDAFGAVHEKKSLKQIIQKHDKRTKVLTHHKFFKSKLAYTLFLNITYAFLPYIERNKVPFVFTLYPGGGFYLNEDKSDNKLKTIFASRYFRKVIVTQKVTLNYLLDNKLCPPDCIEFIYGVVSAPFNKQAWGNKLFYGVDKDTFDICFIANKNMPHGYDKGYDLFIESMKLLSSKYSNINIHVVGPYTKNDYEINGMSNITFHGFIHHDQFEHFFKDKDIIVSPNRPFALQKGAFDGFPTASCTEASLNGVAMFISDPIDLNILYKNGVDCVLIKNDPNWIAKQIERYYKKPKELYQLALNGQNTTFNIYSTENQLIPRINILKSEIQNT
ncbi:MAG: glycosyltransferase family 4 protein [Marinilabiliaceae bacterium]|nr:glycosyltransferase family 4 protein [Marinilabiliaceae bacterium]